MESKQVKERCVEMVELTKAFISTHPGV